MVDVNKLKTALECAYNVTQTRITKHNPRCRNNHQIKKYKTSNLFTILFFIVSKFNLHIKNYFFKFYSFAHYIGN